MYTVEVVNCNKPTVIHESQLDNTFYSLSAPRFGFKELNGFRSISIWSPLFPAAGGCFHGIALISCPVADGGQTQLETHGGI